jgi:hypothetical protein
MSDNTDIENNVPLEKTKTIKPVKEFLEEPIKATEKVKKPRTEKQKAQFQQAMTKRQENIEKKKLEKKLEASKLLVEKDPNFLKQLKEPLTPTFEQEVKPRQKKIIEESESDESVIIIKKKNKPKKKKTIIIEESESSSSSDEEVVQLPKPKSDRKFTTQQNKKSIIKIHNKPSTPSYENYFV